MTRSAVTLIPDSAAIAPGDAAWPPRFPEVSVAYSLPRFHHWFSWVRYFPPSSASIALARLRDGNFGVLSWMPRG